MTHTSTTPRLRLTAWLLDGTETADFLGDAILASADVAVLHLSAAAAALAAGSGTPPPRLRVLAETRWARHVVDGTSVVGDPQIPGPLVAVELDAPIGAEPTPIPLPAPGSDLTTFVALQEFLAEAARNAPAEPPARPAAAGYVRLVPPSHGTKPPWCYVWPGVWGCR